MTPIEFPASVGGWPQTVMAEHIETIERDSYYNEHCGKPRHPQPAQQPLTDDQLFDVFEGKDSEIWWQFDFGRFQMVARAIERAHGIGGEA